jgi:hypothetical protein
MTSRLPSLSLNHAALWSITQAMLVALSKPGKSISSNYTPRSFSARTSASMSTTLKRIWSCEPDALPLLAKRKNSVPLRPL